MVRKLEASDFRARRMVLEPDDFAVPGGPAEVPPDLIDRKVWHELMDLTDHVAITTTSYQGTRVGFLNQLCTDWVMAIPDDCVEFAMIDCADDFTVSIFCLMHGFYRQAVGTLRSILETLLFAALCHLTGDVKRWDNWQKGRDEISFRDVRHQLRKADAIKIIEDKAIAATGRTLFADRNRGDPGGWVTSLYTHLSSFIHASGDLANSSIWQSNGPIYSARGMKVSYCSFLETYALGLLLAKISHPALAMPEAATVLFTYDGRRRYLRQLDMKLCGFIKREVFP